MAQNNYLGVVPARSISLDELTELTELTKLTNPDHWATECGAIFGGGAVSNNAPAGTPVGAITIEQVQQMFARVPAIVLERPLPRRFQSQGCTWSPIAGRFVSQEEIDLCRFRLVLSWHDKVQRLLQGNPDLGRMIAGEYAIFFGLRAHLDRALEILAEVPGSHALVFLPGEDDSYAQAERSLQRALFLIRSHDAFLPERCGPMRARFREYLQFGNGSTLTVAHRRTNPLLGHRFDLLLVPDDLECATEYF